MEKRALLARAYARNTEKNWQAAAENLLLFDPDTGLIKVLNKTAAAVFDLTDGKRTVSEVVDQMLLRYPGEKRSVVEDHVSELYGKLAMHGFVVDA